MKHLNFKSFALGIGMTVLVAGLSVTALAATGQLTLTVDPINIQVNGATFAPTDANGVSVPVFSYNGTTYAPLRALAEAYGLEVGYDAGANMATVGEKAADPATTPVPDTALSDDYSTWSAEEEAAYQEFKGMWEVETEFISDKTEYVSLRCYKLVAVGESASEALHIGESAVNTFLSNNTLELIEKCCYRLDMELYQQYGKPQVLYHFGGKGSWGWTDNITSAGVECGYRVFLDNS